MRFFDRLRMEYAFNGPDSMTSIVILIVLYLVFVTLRHYIPLSPRRSDLRLFGNHAYNMYYVARSYGSVVVQRWVLDHWKMRFRPDERPYVHQFHKEVNRRNKWGIEPVMVRE